MSKLQQELDRRKARGDAPVTLAQMKRALAAIGYRLDRSLDCASMNRYLTGDCAGQSYPAINTGVKEADTGLSAFNVNARRDENFKALQRMRFNEELFAVVRGRILEI